MIYWMKPNGKNLGKENKHSWLTIIVTRSKTKCDILKRLFFCTKLALSGKKVPKYQVKFAISRLLWLICANFLVALSQIWPVCAVIATFSQNQHVRNNKNCCKNYQFNVVWHVFH